LKPSNWSLLLKDEPTGEMYFHAAVGEGSDKLLGLRIKPGEGIAGWVAQHNLPLLVPDVSQDPRFAKRFDEASLFHTSSILCVPLAFKGRTFGVIELVNGAGDAVFAEEDLKILNTVAEFSAIAIENARNFHKVQELTVLDDHTGLFNSRHMKRQLESEVMRATRFGHPVSLLFFDLDHFKMVNDSHGHQAGSRAISPPMRRAAAIAWSLLVSGIRMTNSSPPYRTGTSVERRVRKSSLPTSNSTREPAWWPCESLTILKWSRSKKSSETGCPNRVARTTSDSSCRFMCRELNRPV
jgi:hypothetical protein